MNRDDVIRMWWEADLRYPILPDPERLERFVALVAAAEREACAKLMDEMAEKDKLSNYYRVAALAIRERGAP